MHVDGMKISVLVVILLLLLPAARAEPEYKITYIINVKDDGTAIWNVEYRATLASQDDFNSFNNYTQQLKSVHLNEFKELMQKSVSEAATVTSRNMQARDFTGDAGVQSTPTGTYGVIRYSFTWTNFAEINLNIDIGDVFVGGLYLSKDDTLIIQYPSSYSIEEVEPQPDVIREGIIWYGLRSFGAGEPRIILSRISFPWISYGIAGIIIFIIAASVLFIRQKIKSKINVEKTDIMDLENRIIKLLKDNKGSLYQSDIGRRLGLPKSTVSSALNDLYNKNIIQKIKKGRENLIRLT